MKNKDGGEDYKITVDDSVSGSPSATAIARSLWEIQQEQLRESRENQSAPSASLAVPHLFELSEYPDCRFRDLRKGATGQWFSFRGKTQAYALLKMVALTYASKKFKGGKIDKIELKESEIRAFFNDEANCTSPVKSDAFGKRWLKQLLRNLNSVMVDKSTGIKAVGFSPAELDVRSFNNADYIVIILPK